MTSTPTAARSLAGEGGGDTAAQRVNRARRRLMEDEVISVARALFADRGFDHVTIEEITLAAGVSNRTFYRYFPTKEDLTVVAVERLVERAADALRSRLPAQSPIDALYGVLTTLDSETNEDFLTWVKIGAESPSLRLYQKGLTHDRARGALVAAFAEHMGVDPARDLRPAVIAAAIIGAMDVALERWMVTGGDWARILAEALQILGTSLTAPLERAAAPGRRAGPRRQVLRRPG